MYDGECAYEKLSVIKDRLNSRKKVLNSTTSSLPLILEIPNVRRIDGSRWRRHFIWRGLFHAW
jgi:hypothetical protein